MRILESFFTNPPKLEHYAPRKLQLPQEDSFLLLGARGCGKSALAIDYINNLRNKYLYIDCQDPTFILEELDLSALNSFIKEEQITTLVLDHFFEGFLELLPKVEQIIIIAREPLFLNLPTIVLHPLDFEEFINFKSSLNPATSFDHYSKFGSLPRVAKSINPNLSCREIFFEKFDPQEGKVLLIISLFQAKVTTPHQIYQMAREYFKISKDWLYKAIDNFLKEGILYQVESYERSVGKKIFLYDFILSRYLNKNQTFLTSFESLVTLALIKYKIEIKAINNPLGYLTATKELIVIAPFDSDGHFWTKVQKSFSLYTKLSLNRVTIVTVNSSYSFKIKGINFQALPFYEWVTGL